MMGCSVGGEDKACSLTLDWSYHLLIRGNHKADYGAKNYWCCLKVVPQEWAMWEEEEGN